MGKTNKFAQDCSLCGETVPPQQGRLEYIDQDWLDDNDDFITTPGWHVFHLDTSICDAAVARRKERNQQALAEKQSIDNEAVELSQSITQTSGMKECFDWSWDDFGFSIGSQIAETEHYIAYEYWSSRSPDLDEYAKNNPNLPRPEKFLRGFTLKLKGAR